MCGASQQKTDIRGGEICYFYKTTRRGIELDRLDNYSRVGYGIGDRLLYAIQ